MEFYNTAFPVHLQTNASMHFSRNFYKGMQTHPDWRSLTASFCWPLSTALLRHPLPTAFLSSFFQPSDWRFLAHFPSHRRSRAQAFVWFRAKTNEKIVCLAHPHHSVTDFSWSNERKKVNILKLIGPQRGFIFKLFIYLQHVFLVVYTVLRKG